MLYNLILKQTPEGLELSYDEQADRKTIPVKHGQEGAFYFEFHRMMIGKYEERLKNEGINIDSLAPRIEIEVKCCQGGDVTGGCGHCEIRFAILKPSEQSAKLLSEIKCKKQPIEKRLFEILDDMNKEDINNGTRLVSISNSFISANKIKRGTEIKMGADDQAAIDLLSDKVTPILLLIDKEEYFKRKTK